MIEALCYMIGVPVVMWCILYFSNILKVECSHPDCFHEHRYWDYCSKRDGIK